MKSGLWCIRFEWILEKIDIPIALVFVYRWFRHHSWTMHQRHNFISWYCNVLLFLATYICRSWNILLIIAQLTLHWISKLRYTWVKNTLRSVFSNCLRTRARQAYRVTLQKRIGWLHRKLKICMRSSLMQSFIEHRIILVLWSVIDVTCIAECRLTVTIWVID